MVSIFQCSHCGQTISPDANPGTQVLCPVCDGVIIVPEGRAQVPAVETVPPLMSYAGHVESTGTPNRVLATASLVCGLLGVVGCAPVGIAGLILGFVALWRESREPYRYRGGGMAIMGICLGVLSMVLMVIILPGLLPRRAPSQRTKSQANMRSIGYAMYLYADVNHGKYPDSATNWMDQLSENIGPGTTICPADQRTSGTSYQYVPGYGPTGDPTQIILFEDPRLHNNEGGNILFLDCHVSFVKQPAYQRMIDAIKLPDGSLYRQPKQ